MLHSKCVVNDIETAMFHLRTDKFTYYHWGILCSHYTLTEDFIEKYIDNVNFHRIQIYQTLSESFIDKYADKLDWSVISQYQYLSPALLLKYSDRINWPLCFRYQDINKNAS